MQTRKYLLLYALAIALAALCAATEARANPAGVPLTQPGPLTCSTTNFTMTAVTGPNSLFPIPVDCSTLHPGQICGSYAYTVAKKTSSSKSFNRVVLAVSGDQDFDSANSTPIGTTAANALGAGDGNFLKKAFHEYTVRFSFNTSIALATVSTVIVGPTSARATTINVRGGSDDNDNDSCLIAGPGIAGNIFKPQLATQNVSCAAGKCTCQLSFDAAGNITAVTSPDCDVDTPASLLIDGKPISFFGNEGITIGTGTSTCYPTKPTASCVCILKPCP